MSASVCEAAAQPDEAQLRAAFGTFATGVAVVTAQTQDGRPMGMTINSLTSLSLSPALLLWSVAKKSRSHDDYVAASHFAIHVLGAHQEHLCRQFTRHTHEERFQGIELAFNARGVPLLADPLACFECATHACHDGGDHTIVVGKILSARLSHGKPLLFFRGQTLRL